MGPIPEPLPVETYPAKGRWRNRILTRRPLRETYDSRRAATKIGAALAKRRHARHDVVYTQDPQR